MSMQRRNSTIRVAAMAAVAVVTTLVTMAAGGGGALASSGSVGEPSSDAVATAVAAGEKQTCAVTGAGGVRCWGSNTYGQLGDGTTTNRLAPAPVSGLSSGILQLAVGGIHTCALKRVSGTTKPAGAVKCWGSNAYGQLGDGTTTNRSSQVGVSGLSSGVIGVATGARHTCALTTAGAVKCWGRNAMGQVGDLTVTNRSTPSVVSNLSSGVAMIAAGGNHSCALTDTGAVKCWGANSYGELGDGTTTNRSRPVIASGLTSGVVRITAGGNHSCALTSGGAVKCWGLNANGQVGDATTVTRLTRVSVVGLSSGVSTISGGATHTCAATGAGVLKCFGNNASGRLGDGTTTERSSPVKVSALTNVKAAATGGSHSCALTTAGAVKCWGSNTFGQLGDGTTSGRLTPVNVTGFIGRGGIATGGEHTCMLTAAGAVKCWGDNTYGELGDGTKDNERLTPVGVSGLTSGVTAIAAGGSHTCAVTGAGAAKCWGDNAFGALGDGKTGTVTCPTNFNARCSPIPVAVTGLGSGVATVVAGGVHSCALTTAGGVKCWGQGFSGQLGDGTTEDRFTPTQVTGLTSGVKALAAGFLTTCALMNAGTVKCWGLNSVGQLGDGTKTKRLTPADVIGLPSAGVRAIAAGHSTYCVLTHAGGVKCWGQGVFGQLGNGTTKTHSATPVDVSGLSSGVTAIAAGSGFMCAITSSGALKCWGDSEYGQLGNGTSKTTASTPVAVTGLSAGVALLGSGSSATHFCVQMSAGGLKCWGSNGWGSVGDGTTTKRTTPVDVVGL